MRAEPGSFRDRQSRVFYENGEVLRSLSSEALADWELLSGSDVFARFSEARRLVATELIVGSEFDGRWSGLLRHERIPFVSYPYEWTFGMLKDAALLELDLVLAALDEGLILKDGTPFNVQWRGATPVFIDVGSFTRLTQGEPWAGYRQFCMQFLYPLLIHAYRGLPFQPWLRGSLEGMEPRVCRRLLSFRDFFRAGVVSHVLLHERLERRYGARGGNTGAELAAAGFDSALVKANITRLRRLVARLEPRDEPSQWSDYMLDNSYASDEADRKAEVVRAAAAGLRPKLVWDLGCNDGRYSRIAAEHAEYTVALDADHRTVDALYKSLAADGVDRVLPLVMDVADPSPALGWRNEERKTLTERGTPDLVICLAVVHHLVITRNIPLESFLDWLRSVGRTLLIEFPSEHDPMVQRLLAAKREGHPDYQRSVFDHLVRQMFTVEQQTDISETRTMVLAHPRQ